MNEHRVEKSYLWTVISLFSGEKYAIISILIYAATSGVLLLSVPVAVQAVVNTIAQGGLQQSLVVLSSLLFLVLIFLAILNLLQLYIAEKLQLRLVSRIALTLSVFIPKAKFNNEVKNLDPKHINRFMEVFSVQKIAASILLDGSLVTFKVVFGLILMSFYHPYLTIFSIIITVLFYFILFVFGKNGVSSAIKESTAKYDTLSWLEDLSAYPITFKASNSNDFIVSKTNHNLINYLNFRSKHFSIIFNQQLATFLMQAILSSLLLVLGGYLVMRSELSLGQLVAAELILGYILSGMTRLTYYVQQYYSLVASVDKLDFLIDTPIEETKESVSDISYYELVFNEVVVYSQNKVRFQADNLKIAHGEKLLLFGENNSGKSIFTELLFGLSKPEEGFIQLGSNRISDLPYDFLREHIQLVRGIEIFHGTIEENIRVGYKDASTTQLRNIIKNLGFEKEIDRLPDGLNTKIDLNINPISNTVALKMMIARALIREPEILIIDEIMDAFDYEEKKQIFDYLSASSSYTLIASTHDKFFADSYNRLCFEGSSIIKKTI